MVRSTQVFLICCTPPSLQPCPGALTNLIKSCLIPLAPHTPKPQLPNYSAAVSPPTTPLFLSPAIWQRRIIMLAVQQYYQPSRHVLLPARSELTRAHKGSPLGHKTPITWLPYSYYVQILIALSQFYDELSFNFQRNRSFTMTMYSLNIVKIFEDSTEISACITTGF